MQNRILRKIGAACLSMAVFAGSLAGTIAMVNAEEDPEIFQANLSGLMTENTWFGNNQDAVAAANAKFKLYNDQLNVEDNHYYKEAESLAVRVGPWEGWGDGHEHWSQLWMDDAGRISMLMESGYDSGQTCSLVPRTAAGDLIFVKNFETSFSTRGHGNANYDIALNFRSDAPGRMFDDDECLNGYKNKVTLFINGGGFALTDGTADDSAFASRGDWTEWGFTADNDEEFNVTVRVVGDKLTIKATKGERL